MVTPSVPELQEVERGAQLLCKSSVADQPASKGEDLGAPAKKQGNEGGSCPRLVSRTQDSELSVRQAEPSRGLRSWPLHRVGAAHP